MNPHPLAGDFNALGASLYERLASNDGNIVLSPLSIGTALAMALSGARGETEREMRDALGIALDRAAMDAASGALIAALCGYNRGDSSSIGKSGDAPAIDREEMTPQEEQALAASYRRDSLVHIALANALLLPTATPDLVSPAFRALAEASYAAEVMTGTTLDEINGWASVRTMGLVPRLLQSVNPNAVAYLLNTMIFVANWARPFDATLTTAGDFLLADGSRIEVPTMHQTDHFWSAETENWRALRLACLPPHLALVVGLPKDARRLDTIDAREVARLAAAKDSWRLRHLAVALPRFKIEASSDLVDPLKALGLRLAFHEKDADFTGLADEKLAVWIAQVQHGASIEVHETGIAAAAATVVEIVTRALPEPFDVDRPFLFFLVDDMTGAVLMQGRVVDPRG